MKYGIGGGIEERIEPGAFTASVETKPVVPLFLSHDWLSPIGAASLIDAPSALEFSADLFVEESERAASVARAARAGGLDSVSIGFIPEEIAQDNGVEVIKRAELLEISIVVKGVDPGARIVKVA